MTETLIESNQIVTDALKQLWDTAAKLEKSTNIPQDLDAVEGRRFLLRMLSESVDAFVEHIDPDWPVFRHSEGPHRKMFGDCPDADYLQAPINLRNGRTYKLKGTIPAGTVYIGILLYGKGGRIGQQLRDEELTLDDEGNFELLVSADAGENPDLLGEGDEKLVMVRQYFTDRTSQAIVKLEIEYLGEKATPASLDAAWFARRLELSKKMLEGIFYRTLDAYGRISNFPANQFVEIPVELLFPTPDNTYQICWFEIKEGEKLHLKGKLPKARYFSFTLYNVWLESYDYTRHTISLNHKEIDVESDGTFQITVSNKNPGHTNWLDTSEHTAGYLVARSLVPEGDTPEFDLSLINI